MSWRDSVIFAWRALRGAPGRSLLTLLAMAIGVAAVVVLTALSDGARRYVVEQFQSIGANLLIVFPGRAETTGGTLGMLLGETPRDLTIDDALALLRSRSIRRMAPFNIGAVQIDWRGRSRDVTLIGSSAELLDIRRMKLTHGRFLPAGDPRNAVFVAVIGSKLRTELFGAQNPIGEWLRVGDRRFRVIGVLAPQGVSLGSNTDESVIVPVASAQMLFNSASLFRVLVEARSRADIPRAKQDALSILRARHDGEEDVTVVTQDALVATFDRILHALTLAVGGIAGVSLAVAGVLIMNVMLISVAQRRQEIGLLRALGAPGATVRRLFLVEATVLSVAAAVAGLVLGELGSLAIATAYPVLPATAPPWAVVAALATAVITGAAFSVVPARRAAALDPVVALARR